MAFVYNVPFKKILTWQSSALGCTCRSTLMLICGIWTHAILLSYISLTDPVQSKGTNVERKTCLGFICDKMDCSPKLFLFKADRESLNFHAEHKGGSFNCVCLPRCQAEPHVPKHKKNQRGNPPSFIYATPPHVSKALQMQKGLPFQRGKYKHIHTAFVPRYCVQLLGTAGSFRAVAALRQEAGVAAGSQGAFLPPRSYSTMCLHSSRRAHGKAIVGGRKPPSCRLGRGQGLQLPVFPLHSANRK